MFWLYKYHETSEHCASDALLSDRARVRHRVGAALAGGDASPLAAHRVRHAVRRAALADRRHHRPGRLLPRAHARRTEPRRSGLTRVTRRTPATPDLKFGHALCINNVHIRAQTFAHPSNLLSFICFSVI